MIPYLGWIKVGLAAAAVVASFLAGSTWTARGYQVEIEAIHAEQAEAMAEAEHAARSKEQRLQAAADQVAAKTTRQINELEAQLRRSDAAGRGMRDQLAAANSGGAPSTGTVAAVDDAFVLRTMLVDADRLAGLFAERAERCDIQLRGLQDYVEALVPGVTG